LVTYGGFNTVCRRQVVGVVALAATVQPMPTRTELAEVSAIRCTELQPPALTAGDADAFEAVLQRWRSAPEWNGDAVMFVSSIVAGEELHVGWYRTEYAHLIALARDGDAVPAARRHRGMTFMTHLRCRDGWIVTRRSTRVCSYSGYWQAAAAEGAEARDLTPSVDFAGVARRGLHEELGLDLPRSACSLRATVDLDRMTVHFTASAPDLELADIRASWRTADDGWESDRVDVLDQAQGPFLPGMWQPT
jgi:hypothetical protein